MVPRVMPLNTHTQQYWVSGKAYCGTRGKTGLNNISWQIFCEGNDQLLVLFDENESVWVIPPSWGLKSGPKHAPPGETQGCSLLRGGAR